MSFWQRLKENLNRLKASKPGCRFQEYAAHRQEDRTLYTRAANYAISIPLIATGLAIGWLPGPGGFLALIGLALLAKEFPFIATWLDRLEMVIRSVASHFLTKVQPHDEVK